MASIGRNEPCTCGSQKKYKNCCGKVQSSSVADLAREELLHLQQSYINFLRKNADQTFTRNLDLHKNKFSSHIQDLEGIEAIMAAWLGMVEVYQNEQTYLQAFAEKESKTIVRERVKKTVEDWPNVKVIIGRVAGFDGMTMTVEDAFTHKKEEIVVYEKLSEMGEFVCTLAYPYGDLHGIFLSEMVLPFAKSEQGEQRVRQYFEDSPYTDHEVFLLERFSDVLLDLMDAAFAQDDWSMQEELDNGDWAKPVYKDSGTKLAQYIESENVSEEIGATMIYLLQQYYKKVRPNLKKADLNAAALFYLMDRYFEGVSNGKTQKEVAAAFGVSPASVSKRSAEMEVVLGDVLKELDRGLQPV